MTQISSQNMSRFYLKSRKFVGITERFGTLSLLVLNVLLRKVKNFDRTNIYIFISPQPRGRYGTSPARARAIYYMSLRALARGGHIFV